MNTNILYHIVVLFSVFQISLNQSPCINPNYNSGNCISLYDCPALLQVLKRQPIQEVDRKFLIQSQCNGGTGRKPHVCCTQDTDSEGYVGPRIDEDRTFIKSDIIQESNGKGNILPEVSECGKSPLNNKIYNGNDTGIDEFPWMALLAYEKNGVRRFRCGGTLINQRNILTAAHCVTGNALKGVGELISIRLGEYKISTEIDCISTDCADPVVDIGIEDVIWHNDFTDTERRHDIAIIRLSEDAKYTDFIRPICMPSKVDLPPIGPNQNYVIVGWGKTLTKEQSDVKQKLVIPHVNQRDCVLKYARKKLEITATQFCAGGRHQEDACSGDSGGPLLRDKQSVWAQEGIVSFGNDCGVKGWPGIYTKVLEYEDWIASKLKP